MVRKGILQRYNHLLYIGPHLILFAIFGVIPLFFGAYISFTTWDLTGTPQWVGLSNYKEILFNVDSTFHTEFFSSMKNTFMFVVMTVPLLIIFPLSIALALNTKVKGETLFQSIFYMPGLFSISAVAIIWSVVFNKRIGLVNALFHNDVNWISTQPYAWLVIIIVTVWWTIGGNMIIYRSALNGIDTNMYEAAAIDGSNSINTFFKITLPSIKFQLLYTTVMTTLASFNVYGQPKMLTAGGPSGTTSVVMMTIRDLAFGQGKSIAGIASAMAMIFGSIMVIISIFQFILMSKDNTK